MKLIVIAAATFSGVIGMNNELPFRLREDMRRFRQHTKGHAVIMGRRTRESLGEALLSDRFNIVLTGEYQPSLGDAVVSSLTQAILAASQQGCEKAFVIGGGQVYRAALPICDEALITMVDAPALVGDTFFPLELLNDMALVSRSSFKRDRDNEFDTTFERWIR